VHRDHSQLVLNEISDWFWDVLKQNPGLVNVFSALCKNRYEAKHHIQEGVIAMPECRYKESNHAVFEGRFLSWFYKSILNIMLQPQMNLVVPALHDNENGISCLNLPIGAAEALLLPGDVSIFHMYTLTILSHK